MGPVLIPAALAVAVALPALAQQPERGQLDYSPTMFAVMAAINSAGFDAGLDSPATHPLRKAVREEIARRKPQSAADIRDFMRQHRQQDVLWELRQYMSFSVLVEDPPSFAFRLSENQLPPDVAAMKDFIPLMQRFYKEAGVEELWKKSEPHFDEFARRYQPVAIKAVNEVAGYLRSPTHGTQLGKKYQIYLDLLGPPNQILRMSFLDDYFLIVTHSPEPHFIDIRDTYLHYLLDPLATKFSVKIDEKRPLTDYVQAAPFLADHYKQDFLLLTTKSLIKAIEARLATPSQHQRMVDEAMGQGFVLTAHFAEQLPAYEKQETAMRMYFPEMIDAINLRKEGNRLENLEFSKAPPQRKAKPVAAPPPPPKPEWEKTLESAEDQYAAKNLDKAREIFASVLKQSGDKDVQARVYFGLARIAARQNDAELADGLFRKTLELGPPPQEKAWSMYYLGRLAWIAGEAKEAAGMYRAAIAVPGASEKAKEAAANGLREIADRQK
jgi:hypothetical protein